MRRDGEGEGWLKKEEEGPQFLLPLPVHFRFAAQIFFTLPPATKIFKALPISALPLQFFYPSFLSVRRRLSLSGLSALELNLVW